jgi:prolyl oligopeptidase
MPTMMSPPPQSEIAAVTDILHGISVTDPYRWLEAPDSSRTRSWIQAQSKYSRSYLDAIPNRNRVRDRVQEFLSVHSYDSLLIAGERYFFRKRFPDREQACICARIGPEGDDQVLLDPVDFGLGKYISVRPLRVSPDGRLLLYEIKRGGERSGTFQLLDIQERRTLPEVLGPGYLRGFAFSPDSRSFYYVHEQIGETTSKRCTMYRHVIGSKFDDDQEIFSTESTAATRLHIIPGRHALGLLVHRFLEKTYTDLYLWPFAMGCGPELWLENADYRIAPVLHDSGRLFAITDCGAPNFRIVEITHHPGERASFRDLVRETDSAIQGWTVTENLFGVSYVCGPRTRVGLFDTCGKWLRDLPIEAGETIRLAAASFEKDEFFFERESFTRPIQIYRYSLEDGEPKLWADGEAPFEASEYLQIQVWYTAPDGIQIPMFLVGRRDALETGTRPTIMTSYGGYGLSMTPQFSVFVTYLMERGCLFALPNIRGGSEFGVEWHNAAKRRNRQVAFTDFICAAESLIATGRTAAEKLAIFGGSNSGLLVGVAMTQRPELFRAVVCMAPLLDMLRYHLFDSSHLWKDEFGTAEDPDDFAVLSSYSPYHHVTDGTAYPATMIISGDVDQNCNPMHARKMTARLQAANKSDHPIILDYHIFRGHSPTLPLSERIEALTDRLVFLCDQLELDS